MLTTVRPRDNSSKARCTAAGPTTVSYPSGEGGDEARGLRGPGGGLDLGVGGVPGVRTGGFPHGGVQQAVGSCGRLIRAARRHEANAP